MGARTSAMDAIEITGHISMMKHEGVIRDYATSNVNPDSANGYRWHIYVDENEYVFNRKEARAFVLGNHYRRRATDGR